MGTQSRTACKGHIRFSGPYELFEIVFPGCTKGDIYRAPRTAPLDVTGYRMASRFECTRACWDSLGHTLYPATC